MLGGGCMKLKDFESARKIADETYEADLAKLQHQLQVMQTAYIVRKHRALVVFEGWDASGKGGCIKRLTEPLDPRFFQVWPIAAPDEHELKRHYLYRFWRRLPGLGELAIFDRSWYGRVLVERVEKYCSEAEWRRAYGELNEFEALLIKDGMRVVKLFLHITQDEQDKRLRERLEVPYKRWKTGPDDYRNRAKRTDYSLAIEDMLDKTSTKAAPWTVITANSKKVARLDALSTIVRQLSQGIDLSAPPLDPDFLKIAQTALGVKVMLG
jgi:AMP-polyphosphate phosphotransferase